MSLIFTNATVKRKKFPSVTIGVPMASTFTVCGEFYLSMVGLLKYTMKNKVVKDLNTIHITSAIVEKNRNEITEQFLKSKSAYMLQLDSDMTFPPHYLEHLLSISRQAPDAVVSGMAFMGNPPHHPIMFMKDGEKYAPIHKWPEEPFEVDILGGFGFLCPRSILEKLPEKPFDKIHPYQEDFSFSMRVKEAGFRLIVDPRIQLGHIRPRQITQADFNSTVLPLQQQQAKDKLAENFPQKLSPANAKPKEPAKYGKLESLGFQGTQRGELYKGK